MRNRNVQGLYALLKPNCRVRRQPLKSVEPDRRQIQAWISSRSQLTVVPTIERWSRIRFRLKINFVFREKPRERKSTYHQMSEKRENLGVLCIDQLSFVYGRVQDRSFPFQLYNVHEHNCWPHLPSLWSSDLDEIIVDKCQFELRLNKKTMFIDDKSTEKRWRTDDSWF
jgi:hypothetical protein